MMLYPILILLALAASALFGKSVQAQTADSKPVQVEQARKAKTFHDAVFSKRSVVTIVSNNGVYEGSDDDLELILRADGSVKITEYGFGVQSTVGRYDAKDDGTITIKPNGELEWEPLRWAMEDALLVIRPPTKKVLFDYARKAGVPEVELTDKGYQENYKRWPLREIAARKRSQEVTPE